MLVDRFRTIIIPIIIKKDEIFVLCMNNDGSIKLFEDDQFEDDFINSILMDLYHDTSDPKFRNTVLNDVATKHQCTAILSSSFYIKEDNVVTLYCLGLAWTPLISLNKKWLQLDNPKIKKEDKVLLSHFTDFKDEILFWGQLSSNDYSKTPVIAFDCGGVLLDWDDDLLFRKMAKVFSCTKTDFGELFLGDWLRYSLHIGYRSNYDVFSYLVDKFGPSSYVDFIRVFYGGEKIIEENVQTVVRLRKKYNTTRFILASNTGPLSEDYLLHNTSIKNSFDRGFFSWRIKKTKPDSDFFAYISDHLDNSKILLIDDDYLNRQEARKSGWDTFEVEKNALLDYSQLDNYISQWIRFNIH